MAPKKKSRTMIRVRKSQQPTNFAKPAMEMEKSLLDCSPLLEKLPQSSDCVSKSQPTMKEHTLSKIDWSLLPEELLHLISENLEDCFDVIHARSVSHLWRSIIPFPSCLLRASYSLPSFSKFPFKSKDFCTIEKVPLFLFRVLASPVAAAAASSTSEYFLGGIGRDESEDHMELPSPIQCSVKVMIPGSNLTLMKSDLTLMKIPDCQILMKMLDCLILPLGHQYRVIGCNPKLYRGAAFLPLKKEGGGEEFVVLLNYTADLLVLRSSEMRWVRLKKLSDAICSELVTFRGKFYAGFLNNDIFVIDPYSLDTTPLRPLEFLNCGSCNDLVPSGDDELFLVEQIIPHSGLLDFYRLTLRVCKLDEEAGKWVVVSDIGDRLLFIGDLGNFCCSAKELPDGCGLSGNSIVFTLKPGNVTYSYKYGVHTGREDDDLTCWRGSREKLLTILSTTPVVAFRSSAMP